MTYSNLSTWLVNNMPIRDYTKEDIRYWASVNIDGWREMQEESKEWIVRDYGEFLEKEIEEAGISPEKETLEHIKEEIQEEAEHKGLLRRIGDWFRRRLGLD